MFDSESQSVLLSSSSEDSFNSDTDKLFIRHASNASDLENGIIMEPIELLKTESMPQLDINNEFKVSRQPSSISFGNIDDIDNYGLNSDINKWKRKIRRGRGKGIPSFEDGNLQVEAAAVGEHSIQDDIEELEAMDAILDCRSENNERSLGTGRSNMSLDNFDNIDGYGLNSDISKQKRKITKGRGRKHNMPEEYNLETKDPNTNNDRSDCSLRAIVSSNISQYAQDIKIPIDPSDGRGKELRSSEDDHLEAETARVNEHSIQTDMEELEQMDAILDNLSQKSEKSMTSLKSDDSILGSKEVLGSVSVLSFGSLQDSLEKYSADESKRSDMSNQKKRQSEKGSNKELRTSEDDHLEAGTAKVSEHSIQTDMEELEQMDAMLDSLSQKSGKSKGTPNALSFGNIDDINKYGLNADTEKGKRQIRKGRGKELRTSEDDHLEAETAKVSEHSIQTDMEELEQMDAILDNLSQKSEKSMTSLKSDDSIVGSKEVLGSVSVLSFGSLQDSLEKYSADESKRSDMSNQKKRQSKKGRDKELRTSEDDHLEAETAKVSEHSIQTDMEELEQMDAMLDYLSEKSGKSKGTPNALSFGNIDDINKYGLNADTEKGKRQIRKGRGKELRTSEDDHLEAETAKVSEHSIQTDMEELEQMDAMLDYLSEKSGKSKGTPNALSFGNIDDINKYGLNADTEKEKRQIRKGRGKELRTSEDDHLEAETAKVSEHSIQTDMEELEQMDAILDNLSQKSEKSMTSLKSDDSILGSKEVLGSVSVLSFGSLQDSLEKYSADESIRSDMSNQKKRQSEKGSDKELRTSEDDHLEAGTAKVSEHSIQTDMEELEQMDAMLDSLSQKSGKSKGTPNALSFGNIDDINKYGLNADTEKGKRQIRKGRGKELRTSEDDHLEAETAKVSEHSIQTDMEELEQMDAILDNLSQKSEKSMTSLKSDDSIVGSKEVLGSVSVLSFGSLQDSLEKYSADESKRSDMSNQKKRQSKKGRDKELRTSEDDHLEAETAKVSEHIIQTDMEELEQMDAMLDYLSEKSGKSKGTPNALSFGNIDDINKYGLNADTEKGKRQSEKGRDKELRTSEDDHLEAGTAKVSEHSIQTDMEELEQMDAILDYLSEKSGKSKGTPNALSFGNIDDINKYGLNADTEKGKRQIRKGRGKELRTSEDDHLEAETAKVSEHSIQTDMEELEQMDAMLDYLSEKSGKRQIRKGRGKELRTSEDDHLEAETTQNSKQSILDDMDELEQMDTMLDYSCEKSDRSKGTQKTPEIKISPHLNDINKYRFDIDTDNGKKQMKKGISKEIPISEDSHSEIVAAKISEHSIHADTEELEKMGEILDCKSQRRLEIALNNMSLENKFEEIRLNSDINKQKRKISIGRGRKKRESGGTTQEAKSPTTRNEKSYGSMETPVEEKNAVVKTLNKSKLSSSLTEKNDNDSTTERNERGLSAYDATEMSKKMNSMLIGKEIKVAFSKKQEMKSDVVKQKVSTEECTPVAEALDTTYDINRLSEATVSSNSPQYKPDIKIPIHPSDERGKELRTSEHDHFEAETAKVSEHSIQTDMEELEQMDAMLDNLSQMSEKSMAALKSDDSILGSKEVLGSVRLSVLSLGSLQDSLDKYSADESKRLDMGNQRKRQSEKGRNKEFPMSEDDHLEAETAKVSKRAILDHLSQKSEKSMTALKSDDSIVGSKELLGSVSVLSFESPEYHCSKLDNPVRKGKGKELRTSELHHFEAETAIVSEHSIQTDMEELKQMDAILDNLSQMSEKSMAALKSDDSILGSKEVLGSVRLSVLSFGSLQDSLDKYSADESKRSDMGNRRKRQSEKGRNKEFPMFEDDHLEAETAKVSEHSIWTDMEELEQMDAMLDYLSQKSEKCMTSLKSDDSIVGSKEVLGSVSVLSFGSLQDSLEKYSADESKRSDMSNQKKRQSEKGRDKKLRTSEDDHLEAETAKVSEHSIQTDMEELKQMDAILDNLSQKSEKSMTSLKSDDSIVGSKEVLGSVSVLSFGSLQDSFEKYSADESKRSDMSNQKKRQSKKGRDKELRTSEDDHLEAETAKVSEHSIQTDMEELEQMDAMLDYLSEKSGKRQIRKGRGKELRTSEDDHLEAETTQNSKQSILDDMDELEQMDTMLDYSCEKSDRSKGTQKTPEIKISPHLNDINKYRFDIDTDNGKKQMKKGISKEIPISEDSHSEIVAAKISEHSIHADTEELEKMGEILDCKSQRRLEIALNNMSLENKFEEIRLNSDINKQKRKISIGRGRKKRESGGTTQEAKSPTTRNEKSYGSMETPVEEKNAVVKTLNKSKLSSSLTEKNDNDSTTERNERGLSAYDATEMSKKMNSMLIGKEIKVAFSKKQEMKSDVVKQKVSTEECTPVAEALDTTYDINRLSEATVSSNSPQYKPDIKIPIHPSDERGKELRTSEHDHFEAETAKVSEHSIQTDMEELEQMDAMLDNLSQMSEKSMAALKSDDSILGSKEVLGSVRLSVLSLGSLQDSLDKYSADESKRLDMGNQRKRQSEKGRNKEFPMSEDDHLEAETAKVSKRAILDHLSQKSEKSMTALKSDDSIVGSKELLGSVSVLSFESPEYHCSKLDNPVRKGKGKELRTSELDQFEAETAKVSEHSIQTDMEELKQMDAMLDYLSQKSEKSMTSLKSDDSIVDSKEVLGSVSVLSFGGLQDNLEKYSADESKRSDMSNQRKRQSEKGRDKKFPIPVIVSIEAVASEVSEHIIQTDILEELESMGTMLDCLREKSEKIFGTDRSQTSVENTGEFDHCGPNPDISKRKKKMKKRKGRKLLATEECTQEVVAPKCRNDSSERSSEALCSPRSSQFEGSRLNKPDIRISANSAKNEYRSSGVISETNLIGLATMSSKKTNEPSEISSQQDHGESFEEQRYQSSILSSNSELLLLSESVSLLSMSVTVDNDLKEEFLTDSREDDQILMTGNGIADEKQGGLVKLSLTDTAKETDKYISWLKPVSLENGVISVPEVVVINDSDEKVIKTPQLTSMNSDHNRVETVDSIPFANNSTEAKPKLEEDAKVIEVTPSMLGFDNFDCDQMVKNVQDETEMRSDKDESDRGIEIDISALSFSDEMSDHASENKRVFKTPVDSQSSIKSTGLVKSQTNLTDPAEPDNGDIGSNVSDRTLSSSDWYSYSSSQESLEITDRNKRSSFETDLRNAKKTLSKATAQKVEMEKLTMDPMLDCVSEKSEKILGTDGSQTSVENTGEFDHCGPNPDISKRKRKMKKRKGRKLLATEECTQEVVAPKCRNDSSERSSEALCSPRSSQYEGSRLNKPDIRISANSAKNEYRSSGVISETNLIGLATMSSKKTNEPSEISSQQDHGESFEEQRYQSSILSSNSELLLLSESVSLLSMSVTVDNDLKEEFLTDSREDDQILMTGNGIADEKQGGLVKLSLTDTAKETDKYISWLKPVSLENGVISVPEIVVINDSDEKVIKTPQLTSMNSDHNRVETVDSISFANNSTEAKPKLEEDAKVIEVTPSMLGFDNFDCDQMVKNVQDETEMRSDKDESDRGIEIDISALSFSDEMSDHASENKRVFKTPVDSQSSNKSTGLVKSQTNLTDPAEPDNGDICSNVSDRTLSSSDWYSYSSSQESLEITDRNKRSSFETDLRNAKKTLSKATAQKVEMEKLTMDPMLDCVSEKSEKILGTDGSQTSVENTSDFDHCGPNPDISKRKKKMKKRKGRKLLATEECTQEVVAPKCRNDSSERSSEALCSPRSSQYEGSRLNKPDIRISANSAKNEYRSSGVISEMNLIGLATMSSKKTNEPSEILPQQDHGESFEEQRYQSSILSSNSELLLLSESVSLLSMSVTVDNDLKMEFLTDSLDGDQILLTGNGIADEKQGGLVKLSLTDTAKETDKYISWLQPVSSETGVMSVPEVVVINDSDEKVIKTPQLTSMNSDHNRVETVDSISFANNSTEAKPKLEEDAKVIEVSPSMLGFDSFDCDQMVKNVQDETEMRSDKDESDRGIEIDISALSFSDEMSEHASENKRVFKTLVDSHSSNKSTGLVKSQTNLTDPAEPDNGDIGYNVSDRTLSSSDWCSYSSSQESLEITDRNKRSSFETDLRSAKKTLSKATAQNVEMEKLTMDPMLDCMSEKSEISLGNVRSHNSNVDNYEIDPVTNKQKGKMRQRMWRKRLSPEEVTMVKDVAPGEDKDAVVGPLLELSSSLSKKNDSNTTIEWNKKGHTVHDAIEKLSKLKKCSYMSSQESLETTDRNKRSSFEIDLRNAKKILSKAGTQKIDIEELEVMDAMLDCMSKKSDTSLETDQSYHVADSVKPDIGSKVSDRTLSSSDWYSYSSSNESLEITDRNKRSSFETDLLAAKKTLSIVKKRKMNKKSHTKSKIRDIDTKYSPSVSEPCKVQSSTTGSPIVTTSLGMDGLGMEVVSKNDSPMKSTSYSLNNFKEKCKIKRRNSNFSLSIIDKEALNTGKGNKSSHKYIYKVLASGKTVPIDETSITDIDSDGENEVAPRPPALETTEKSGEETEQMYEIAVGGFSFCSTEDIFNTENNLVTSDDQTTDCSAESVMEQNICNDSEDSMRFKKTKITPQNLSARLSSGMDIPEMLQTWNKNTDKKLFEAKDEKLEAGIEVDVSNISFTTKTDESVYAESSAIDSTNTSITGSASSAMYLMAHIQNSVSEVVKISNTEDNDSREELPTDFPEDDKTLVIDIGSSTCGDSVEFMDKESIRVDLEELEAIESMLEFMSKTSCNKSETGQSGMSSKTTEDLDKQEGIESPEGLELSPSELSFESSQETDEKESSHESNYLDNKEAHVESCESEVLPSISSIPPMNSMNSDFKRVEIVGPVSFDDNSTGAQPKIKDAKVIEITSSAHSFEVNQDIDSTDVSMVGSTSSGTYLMSQVPDNSCDDGIVDVPSKYQLPSTYSLTYCKSENDILYSTDMAESDTSIETIDEERCGSELDFLDQDKQTNSMLASKKTEALDDDIMDVPSKYSLPRTYSLMYCLNEDQIYGEDEGDISLSSESVQSINGDALKNEVRASVRSGTELEILDQDKQTNSMLASKKTEALDDDIMDVPSKYSLPRTYSLMYCQNEDQIYGEDVGDISLSSESVQSINGDALKNKVRASVRSGTELDILDQDKQTNSMLASKKTEALDDDIMDVPSKYSLPRTYSLMYCQNEDQIYGEDVGDISLSSESVQSINGDALKNKVRASVRSGTELDILDQDKQTNSMLASKKTEALDDDIMDVPSKYSLPRTYSLMYCQNEDQIHGEDVGISSLSSESTHSIHENALNTEVKAIVTASNESDHNLSGNPDCNYNQEKGVIKNVCKDSDTSMLASKKTGSTPLKWSSRLRTGGVEKGEEARYEGPEERIEVDMSNISFLSSQNSNLKVESYIDPDETEECVYIGSSTIDSSDVSVAGRSSSGTDLMVECYTVPVTNQSICKDSERSDIIDLSLFSKKIQATPSIFSSTSSSDKVYPELLEVCIENIEEILIEPKLESPDSSIETDFSEISLNTSQNNDLNKETNVDQAKFKAGVYTGFKKHPKKNSCYTNLASMNESERFVEIGMSEISFDTGSLQDICKASLTANISCTNLSKLADNAEINTFTTSDILDNPIEVCDGLSNDSPDNHIWVEQFDQKIECNTVKSLVAHGTGSPTEFLSSSAVTLIGKSTQDMRNEPESQLSERPVRSICVGTESQDTADHCNQAETDHRNIGTQVSNSRLVDSSCQSTTEAKEPIERTYSTASRDINPYLDMVGLRKHMADNAENEPVIREIDNNPPIIKKSYMNVRNKISGVFRKNADSTGIAGKEHNIQFEAGELVSAPSCSGTVSLCQINITSADSEKHLDDSCIAQKSNEDENGICEKRRVSDINCGSDYMFPEPPSSISLVETDDAYRSDNMSSERQGDTDEFSGCSPESNPSSNQIVNWRSYASDTDEVRMGIEMSMSAMSFGSSESGKHVSGSTIPDSNRTSKLQYHPFENEKTMEDVELNISNFSFESISADPNCVFVNKEVVDQGEGASTSTLTPNLDSDIYEKERIVKQTVCNLIPTLEVGVTDISFENKPVIRKVDYNPPIESRSYKDVLNKIRDASEISDHCNQAEPDHCHISTQVSNSKMVDSSCQWTTETEEPIERTYSTAGRDKNPNLDIMGLKKHMAENAENEPVIREIDNNSPIIKRSYKYVRNKISGVFRIEADSGQEHIKCEVGELVLAPSSGQITITSAYSEEQVDDTCVTQTSKEYENGTSEERGMCERRSSMNLVETDMSSKRQRDSDDVNNYNFTTPPTDEVRMGIEMSMSAISFGSSQSGKHVSGSTTPDSKRAHKLRYHPFENEKAVKDVELNISNFSFESISVDPSCVSVKKEVVDQDEETSKITQTQNLDDIYDKERILKQTVIREVDYNPPIISESYKDVLKKIRDASEISDHSNPDETDHCHISTQVCNSRMVDSSCQWTTDTDEPIEQTYSVAGRDKNLYIDMTGLKTRMANNTENDREMNNNPPIIKKSYKDIRNNNSGVFRKITDSTGITGQEMLEEKIDKIRSKVSINEKCQSNSEDDEIAVNNYFGPDLYANIKVETSKDSLDIRLSDTTLVATSQSLLSIESSIEDDDNREATVDSTMQSISKKDMIYGDHDSSNGRECQRESAILNSVEESWVNIPRSQTMTLQTSVFDIEYLKFMANVDEGLKSVSEDLQTVREYEQLLCDQNAGDDIKEFIEIERVLESIEEKAMAEKRLQRRFHIDAQTRNKPESSTPSTDIIPHIESGSSQESGSYTITVPPEMLDLKSLSVGDVIADYENLLQDLNSSDISNEAFREKYEITRSELHSLGKDKDILDKIAQFRMIQTLVNQIEQKAAASQMDDRQDLKFNLTSSNIEMKSIAARVATSALGKIVTLGLERIEPVHFTKEKGSKDPMSESDIEGHSLEVNSDRLLWDAWSKGSKESDSPRNAVDMYEQMFIHLNSPDLSDIEFNKTYDVSKGEMRTFLNRYYIAAGNCEEASPNTRHRSLWEQFRKVAKRSPEKRKKKKQSKSKMKFESVESLTDIEPKPSSIWRQLKRATKIARTSLGSLDSPEKAVKCDCVNETDPSVRNVDTQVSNNAFSPESLERTYSTAGRDINPYLDMMGLRKHMADNAENEPLIREIDYNPPVIKKSYLDVRSKISKLFQKSTDLTDPKGEQEAGNLASTSINCHHTISRISAFPDFITVKTDSAERQDLVKDNQSPCNRSNSRDNINTDDLGDTDSDSQKFSSDISVVSKNLGCRDFEMKEQNENPKEMHLDLETGDLVSSSSFNSQSSCLPVPPQDLDARENCESLYEFDTSSCDDCGSVAITATVESEDFINLESLIGIIERNQTSLLDQKGKTSQVKMSCSELDVDYPAAQPVKISVVESNVDFSPCLELMTGSLGDLNDFESRHDRQEAVKNQSDSSGIDMIKIHAEFDPHTDVSVIAKRLSSSLKQTFDEIVESDENLENCLTEMSDANSVDFSLDVPLLNLGSKSPQDDHFSDDASTSTMNEIEQLLTERTDQDSETVSCQEACGVFSDEHFCEPALSEYPQHKEKVEIRHRENREKRSLKKGSKKRNTLKFCLNCKSCKTVSHSSTESW